MHGDIAPGHEGYREGAAADPDQAGNAADNAPRAEHAAPVGQLARGLGLDVGAGESGWRRRKRE